MNEFSNGRSSGSTGLGAGRTIAPGCDRTSTRDDADLLSMMRTTALSAAAGGDDLPQVDGFEIRERLGGDGQGDVFRAYDQNLRCDVALKAPREDGAASHERFISEARALAKVRHPNIVGIHAYGCCRGRPYFTMDLIDGPDVGRLVQRLRRRSRGRPSGRLLFSEVGLERAALTDEVRRTAVGRDAYYRLVALWTAQAAEGLAAAQQAGVLHRDIKTANLLLSPDGRMMVADFGLARSILELPALAASGVVGTYPYVAPERVSGLDNVDFRSDIWALGATLYELLTLQRAYPRNSAAVLRDITTLDPDPPSSLRPDVPAGLERICLRMLERDPDRRFQSWDELSQGLRGWLDRGQRRSAWWIAVPAVALAIAASLMALRFVPEAPAPVVRATWEPAAVVAPAKRPIATSRPTTPPGAPHKAPIIFLACTEDLNVGDARPPTSGGYAEQYLQRRLMDRGIDVRSSAETPRCWEEGSAREAAGRIGADILVWARLEARVLQRERMAANEQTVYRWELALSVKVVRLGDQRAWNIPVDRVIANVAAAAIEGLDLRSTVSRGGREIEFSAERRTWEKAAEFGGDMKPVARLAGVAADGIVKVLETVR